MHIYIHSSLTTNLTLNPYCAEIANVRVISIDNGKPNTMKGRLALKTVVGMKTVKVPIKMYIFHLNLLVSER